MMILNFDCNFEKKPNLKKSVHRINRSLMSASLNLISACVTLLITVTMANADVQIDQVGTPEKRVLQSSLTEPELNWLRKHKTIRHGIASNQMPFEYVDDNGHYRFSIDISLDSSFSALISFFSISYSTIFLLRNEKVNLDFSSTPLGVRRYT